MLGMLGSVGGVLLLAFNCGERGGGPRPRESGRGSGGKGTATGWRVLGLGVEICFDKELKLRCA